MVVPPALIRRSDDLVGDKECDGGKAGLGVFRGRDMWSRDVFDGVAVR